MLLSIFGGIMMAISVAILVSGSLILYLDHFEDLTGLQEKLELQYDYSHYWLGAVYLVSSILTLCSAWGLYRRRLTFITTTFLLLAMALSLFAMILDGPDWIEWKDMDRKINYWDKKDRYSCSSNNKTCICQQNAIRSNYITITTITDCDDVVYISALFGFIVGGAVVGFSLSVASLLLMINSVSWKKPWKAFASYTTSYENELATNNIMQLHPERPSRHPTMAPRTEASLSRRYKECMPAWSVYGSTIDDPFDPNRSYSSVGR